MCDKRKWSLQLRVLLWSNCVRYNIRILNYKCKRSFFHLEMFGTCITGITRMHSPSALAFCSNENFGFTETTCLTELFVKCINWWFSRWIRSGFDPLAALYSLCKFGFVKPQDTLRFLDSCRYWLDCSAPDDISLQLHVRADVQNFENCNLAVRMMHLAWMLHNTFSHCKDHTSSPSKN